MILKSQGEHILKLQCWEPEIRARHEIVFDKGYNIFVMCFNQHKFMANLWKKVDLNLSLNHIIITFSSFNVALLLQIIAK